MSSADGRYNTDLKLFGLLFEISHYKYILIYIYLIILLLKMYINLYDVYIFLYYCIRCIYIPYESFHVSKNYTYISLCNRAIRAYHFFHECKDCVDCVNYRQVYKQRPNNSNLNRP